MHSTIKHHTVCTQYTFLPSSTQASWLQASWTSLSSSEGPDWWSQHDKHSSCQYWVQESRQHLASLWQQSLVQGGMWDLNWSSWTKEPFFHPVGGREVSLLLRNMNTEHAVPGAAGSYSTSTSEACWEQRSNRQTPSLRFWRNRDWASLCRTTSALCLDLLFYRMVCSFVKLEGVFSYLQQESLLVLKEIRSEMHGKKGTPLR